MDFVEIVPWFLPGVLLSLIVGVATRRSVARFLAVSPAIAAALIASAGWTVAATLTPLRRALESDAAGTGGCDLSRLRGPTLEEVVGSGSDEVLLNLLLFVPLGFTIGLAPRSRQKAVLLLVGVLMPVSIEAIQLLTPVLVRGCESADIVDNLLGLALGVTTATVAHHLSSLIPPAN